MRTAQYAEHSTQGYIQNTEIAVKCPERSRDPAIISQAAATTATAVMNRFQRFRDGETLIYPASAGN